MDDKWLDKENLAKFNETIQKIFSEDFKKFLFYITSCCNEDKKLQEETKQLLCDINEVMNKKDVKSCISVLLFYLTYISTDEEISGIIDSIGKFEKNRRDEKEGKTSYIG